MSTREIEKIIDNAAFSLEMEGFSVPDEQKNEWRTLLRGETDFNILLQTHIQRAKEMGRQS